jgi:hypothetical protein
MRRRDLERTELDEPATRELVRDVRSPRAIAAREQRLDQRAIDDWPLRILRDRPEQLRRLTALDRRERHHQHVPRDRRHVELAQ